MVMTTALAGCNAGRDYKRPDIAPPESFGLPTTQASTRPVASLDRWWTAFNDPKLSELIERAIEGNLDLRLARERIIEARAQRGVIAGDYYPQLDATGKYSRAYQSLNSPFSAGQFSGVRDSDLYTAGFDASWEIDVFGGVRRGVEAADADLAAADESRRDALLTLLGDVAQSYVELRGAQAEIRIARQNVDAQAQTLELTRTRANAGIVTGLDVARAEAQVASTESRVPTLQAQATRAINRLSVLLGKPPAALYAELNADSPPPSAEATVPLGLPGELMLRRPDVRQAERELAAATARTGVARADLYPRFSLTGSFGVESEKLGNLVESDSFFSNFGPSVKWAILDFGRIRSNIAVQDARAQQALTRYEQTMLASLEEVNNAATNLDRERERREKLQASTKANRDAVEIARTLYERGLADFINVLDAQRSLFEAEDQLTQSETAVSQNLVALFKALGGGWNSFETVDD
jgi:outer membrane protein, multidrug efflux system